jgi:hypothetical protein
MNVVERIAIGDDVRLAFHCQGCKCGHAFRIQGPQPVWDWNGSMERPTFAPSLLYRMHDPATGQQLSCCHSFPLEVIA